MRWITPSVVLGTITLLGAGANLLVRFAHRLPVQSASSVQIRTTGFSSEESLPDLIERTNRSILKIKAGREVGTAYVVRNGYVLTNAHVVRTRPIRLYTQAGDEVSARLIGTDSTTDVALLRLTVPSQIPSLTLGNSDQVRSGDAVIAIGMPFDQDFAATSGIISAKNRTRINLKHPTVEFLQTDAAINPGNSGGPLLNLQGEVIGMNTAIADRAQNIGFALPINTTVQSARKILAAPKR